MRQVTSLSEKGPVPSAPHGQFAPSWNPHHFFSGPPNDCFSPSACPVLLLCPFPVFSLYCSSVVRKETHEEHFAQLQLVPTACSPSDRHPLLTCHVQAHTPVMLSCVHTHSSVNSMCKGTEIHITLALLCRASQKDGMVGLAKDMTAPSWCKDLPHRIYHTVVFPLSLPHLPGRRGTLGSHFLLIILLQQTGRMLQSLSLVWSTPAPYLCCSWEKLTLFLHRRFACMVGERQPGLFILNAPYYLH